MRYLQLACHDWKCDAYFAIDGYWMDDILRNMREVYAPIEIQSRVWRNMSMDKMDTGFTFTNPRLRHSVMVVGRSSTGAEFLNSFTHELRHLVDDIAAERGYTPRGENVAYLTGDISLVMADVVCELSCDCCRSKKRER